MQFTIKTKWDLLMNRHIGGFRFLLIFLMAFFFGAQAAFSTTLPANILDTIKKELPNASVRFDGLISLPNGTVYLPVLPSNPKRNAKGAVLITVPAGKKLAQLPDVVLFDSNFALLKVVKTKDGKTTITDSKNIPFVVKTGIFPQDMLVPPGLVIPDDLQIMMGDLKIATKSSRVNEIFKDTKKTANSSANTTIVPVPYMVGKTMLVTTLDSKVLSVLPSDSTVPKFTLNLENLPKFIQPVCDDKYILVASAGKTYIDVADIKQEVLAKKIDLSSQPSEVILNSDKSKAYVAVSDDQAIFVIDLKSMSLLEKIKIKGYPKNIAISANDKAIVYQDKNTGDIYTLALDETYLNRYVYNASNVSKLAIRDNNIYLISRTLNELQVIDTEIKDIIYKQEVGQKPVDMVLLNNKLYILCAAQELDIFNLEDFSFEKAMTFSGKGFLKKLVMIPGSDMFLITNISEKKYYIYDINKNSIVQTVNTNVYINDLQLISKSIK